MFTSLSHDHLITESHDLTDTIFTSTSRADAPASSILTLHIRTHPHTSSHDVISRTLASSLPIAPGTLAPVDGQQHLLEHALAHKRRVHCNIRQQRHHSLETTKNTSSTRKKKKEREKKERGQMSLPWEQYQRTW
eukprot:3082256-Rhodomonas_salina.7